MLRTSLKRKQLSAYNTSKLKTNVDKVEQFKANVETLKRICRQSQKGISPKSKIQGQAKPHQYLQRRDRRTKMRQVQLEQGKSHNNISKVETARETVLRNTAPQGPCQSQNYKKGQSKMLWTSPKRKQLSAYNTSKLTTNVDEVEQFKANVETLKRICRQSQKGKTPKSKIQVQAKPH